jgi:alkylation response protein AidB-like acyl-CoA dehydrogenase
MTRSDPDTRSQVLALADALAEELATDAVARDRAGGTAKKQRDRLRDSGLLGLSVPAELGGLGAPWSVVMEVVRRLARADGAIAHLFGFHHLLLATLRLFGDVAQWRPHLRAAAERRLFWGNALNPLDPRTTLRAAGDAFLLDGEKSFTSGARDSDWLIVSATSEATGKLVVAALPTTRAGILVRDDWDAMGQRQTDSGTVSFSTVRVEAREILASPGPLGSTFASLRPLIAQLALANVYLGIAEGSFIEAKAIARGRDKAWFLSGAPSFREDPYVLRHAGEIALGLKAAQLLTDEAGRALEAAWSAGDALTEQGRGEAAIAIARAKAFVTQVGLDVTCRVFELTGARGALGKHGLDRHWRNLRTHTLHDPVDYKIRELGVNALDGSFPPASFYS